MQCCNIPHCNVFFCLVLFLFCFVLLCLFFSTARVPTHVPVFFACLLVCLFVCLFVFVFVSFLFHCYRIFTILFPILILGFRLWWSIPCLFYNLCFFPVLAIFQLKYPLLPVMVGQYHITVYFMLCASVGWLV